MIFITDNNLANSYLFNNNFENKYEFAKLLSAIKNGKIY